MIRRLCPALRHAGPALMIVLAGSICADAQVYSAGPPGDFPDSPLPAITATAQAAGANQEQASPPTAPNPADDRTKAQQQLQQQKQQRLFGIVPMFNTSYVSDAVSMTPGEKIKLAFRSAIDPASFALPAIVAGIGELNAPANNNGFGWGPSGYFKKWGAAYLDAFNGRMIGNGFLPALLRQDPRYFRRGKGSGTRRVLYAMSSVAVCRHDNSRHMEPNYSKLGGNFAAGALSNLYYPPRSSRSAGQQTVASALIVTTEGALGAIFQEFWPDISRKLFHKDPTHGLDSQAKAAAHPAQPATQSPKPKQPLAQPPE